MAIERTRGFLNALDFHVEHRAALHDSVQISQLNDAARTRLKDAVSSVNIEGASLSLEKAFELARNQNLQPQTAGEAEFLNYLSAFEAIESYRAPSGKTVWQNLGIGDLLNIHRLIVAGVRGGSRFAGTIRAENVVVGDRVEGEEIVHHTPINAMQVRDELDALFDWINRASVHPNWQEIEAGAPDLDWVHPVIVAGIAHHRLVWIHPFVDGNGRSARMFTTLLLFARGYDFKYLFDLSSYYDENQNKYYDFLREADRSGDYTCWLEYFLGGFAQQMFQIEASAKALHARAQQREFVQQK